MQIGIIGSRGIPAKYGGFEVFTEQLSTRLVEKGYSVVVGCEYTSRRDIDEFKGVRLCYFPFPPPKQYFLRKLYEIINDVYYMIKLCRRCDVIYMLGTGAGAFMFIPKMLNRKGKILVNIDGLEWKRGKFSKFEKMLLKLNTYLATVFADTIVLDAKSMENHISKSCKRKAVFIPYGVEAPKEVSWDKTRLEVLAQRCNRITEIKQYDYWLVVARLEPENNIHVILEGYLKSNSKKHLVVVGDYTSERYKKVICSIVEKDKKDKEKRILMLGAIYDDRDLLNMLRQNCFAYIHGHSVGGTNPSLLEAMSMKNIIVAHDNEFNREVCGDTAIYFKDRSELREKIESIERNPEIYTKLKYETYKRVMKNYSWERVVTEYENLFNNIGVVK